MLYEVITLLAVLLCMSVTLISTTATADTYSLSATVLCAALISYGRAVRQEAVAFKRVEAVRIRNNFV